MRNVKLVSNKLRILGENPPFPHLAIGLQTGGLQDGDLELLHGPVNLVCIYKRLIVEDVHTGQLITYTAADHHEEALYSCSYIQILPEIASTSHQPTFGRIKMCFTHTFAGSVHKLVLLDVYPTSQQDSESGIWWVPIDCICEEAN